MFAEVIYRLNILAVGESLGNENNWFSLQFSSFHPSLKEAKVYTLPKTVLSRLATATEKKDQARWSLFS